MKNESESESTSVNVSVETLQPSALEAMERAQIDVQISTAKRYPRSMELFQRRAMAMVSLDEETAASCIYRRPVGKKNGVEEFAEGESVRMAEIVGASYGNLRVSSKIVEQTPRYVKCVGMAHDLESNFASQAEVMEPTVKRDGSPYSESMRAVVAKACLSKAWRDAVFKVVPRSLCKGISDEARKVAIGDSSTLEKRRAKAADWANKCGVGVERVWAALGVKGPADLTLEHLETLTGIRTAIKDGDTNLDQAFPDTKFTPKVVDKEKPAEQAQPQQTATPTPVTTVPPAAATDDDEDEIRKEAAANKLRAEQEAKAKTEAEEKSKAEAAKKAPPASTKPKAPDWKSDRDKPLLAEKLTAAGLTQAQLCGWMKSHYAIEGCTTIDELEGIAPKALSKLLFKFDEAKAEIATMPGKSAV